jgi:hypothetical protein
VIPAAIGTGSGWRRAGDEGFLGDSAVLAALSELTTALYGICNQSVSIPLDSGHTEQIVNK